MYSIISGARIPVQMAIADRTLDPPGDFGSEHTDALCTRDMGWLMGWAATPQEVFDKSLLFLPFIKCMETSHNYNSYILSSYEIAALTDHMLRIVNSTPPDHREDRSKRREIVNLTGERV